MGSFKGGQYRHTVTLSRRVTQDGMRDMVLQKAGRLEAEGWKNY
jgi:hypothetical protein